jgi:hypothetical protein
MLFMVYYCFLQEDEKKLPMDKKNKESCCEKQQ